jgi:hypothetical protein
VEQGMVRLSLWSSNNDAVWLATDTVRISGVGGMAVFSQASSSVSGNVRTAGMISLFSAS